MVEGPEGLRQMLSAVPEPHRPAALRILDSLIGLDRQQKAARVILDGLRSERDLAAYARACAALEETQDRGAESLAAIYTDLGAFVQAAGESTVTATFSRAAADVEDQVTENEWRYDVLQAPFYLADVMKLETDPDSHVARALRVRCGALGDRTDGPQNLLLVGDGAAEVPLALVCLEVRPERVEAFVIGCGDAGEKRCSPVSGKRTEAIVECLVAVARQISGG